MKPGDSICCSIKQGILLYLGAICYTLRFIGEDYYLRSSARDAPTKIYLAGWLLLRIDPHYLGSNPTMSYSWPNSSWRAEPADTINSMPDPPGPPAGSIKPHLTNFKAYKHTRIEENWSPIFRMVGRYLGRIFNQSNSCVACCWV